MRPGPQPALLAGGELLVGEDLGDGPSCRACEGPPPGRAKWCAVPGTPGPPGADANGEQRQDRESREDGDENRVGKHAGVGDRAGTGPEGARGGDHDREQGRDGGVHEPEVTPAVDEPRQRAREGEALRGELPEGAHYGGRIRARRALGRAFCAAVAVPDLSVGDEAVLQPEPDEGHLPAGEHPLVTGEVAGGGAGPALQARLEGGDVSAVGLEERAVGTGGEVEGPVRQDVDRLTVQEPTEFARTPLPKRGASRGHYRIHPIHVMS